MGWQSRIMVKKPPNPSTLTNNGRQKNKGRSAWESGTYVKLLRFQGRRYTYFIRLRTQHGHV